MITSSKISSTPWRRVNSRTPPGSRAGEDGITGQHAQQHFRRTSWRKKS